MTRGVVNLDEVVVPFYNRGMQLCTVSLAATLGTLSCLYVFLSSYVCMPRYRERQRERKHALSVSVCT